MSKYLIVEGIDHGDGSYSAGDPMSSIVNTSLTEAFNQLRDAVGNVDHDITPVALGMFKHLPGVCIGYLETWKENGVDNQRTWLIKQYQI
jgi:hypothetical protein